MKGILGLVSVLAIGTAGVSAPQPVHAGWGVDTVNCYSDRGRRSYCRVPWRDARLARQDSRTACVRGRTWGMDRGGIWVDDGCRGIFEEAGGWRDDHHHHDVHHHYYDPHHGDHGYRGRYD